MLSQRLLFARDLVYFHINTTSYARNVQTAKNRKMPYFHAKQFVTTFSLMSHGGGELEYSKCPTFETKGTIDLKTC